MLVMWFVVFNDFELICVACVAICSVYVSVCNVYVFVLLKMCYCLGNHDGRGANA